MTYWLGLAFKLVTWPHLYCAAEIERVIRHLDAQGWEMAERTGEMVTAVCTCGSQHRFTFTLWPRLPEGVWHDVEMTSARSCMKGLSR
jgi:hypothetical protein